jgi:hypothetical protein
MWLALVLLLAGALRAFYVGATSLWWDELVQIQAASLPRFLDVLWWVRRGDPPGLGNAGAVPLDYLLMHAYLQVTPISRPESIEIYYRLPSWFFSTAAVVAVFLTARRFFGRGAAVLAALFLAISVPHALYAGEARFYSAFTFVTVLCFAAYSRVVENPGRPLAWIVHALAGLITFLTGLLGLLLLVGQYVLLAGVVLSDWSDERRRTRVRDPARGGRSTPRDGRKLAVPLALVAASCAAFALVLWGFYRDTWVFLRLQHSDEGRGPWQAGAEVISYFALESPAALLLLAVGSIAVPLMARRDRTRLAISLHLVTSFLWLPVLAHLANWKGYYVHPRHGLFLLPYFALVLGIGLDGLLNRIPLSFVPAARRDFGRLVLGVVLVLAIGLRPVIGFLREPLRYAALVRPTDDTRGLVQHLAGKAAALPEDQVYLLAAERKGGAYLRNPAVAWYLRRYGLHGRVVLRTASASEDVLARLDASCASGGRCVERPVAAVAGILGLGPSIDVRGSLRTFLGIDQATALPRSRVGMIGVVRYRRDPRAPPAKSPRQIRSGRGWTLFEPALR